MKIEFLGLSRLNTRPQSAKRRVIQFQVTAVGLKHLLDDGQSEARAIAATIELLAPLDDGCTLLDWDSWAVIFDLYPITLHRDPNPRIGVPGRIFNKVAEDLREIRFFHRDRSIVRTIDLKNDMRAFGRALLDRNQ